jgi:hypothetical protein
VRLVTAFTPLARCDELLALVRRPPPALAAFRQAQEARVRGSVGRASAGAETGWLDEPGWQPRDRALAGAAGTSAHEGAALSTWWDGLLVEHVRGGLHAPMQVGGPGAAREWSRQLAAH